MPILAQVNQLALTQNIIHFPKCSLSSAAKCKGNCLPKVTPMLTFRVFPNTCPIGSKLLGNIQGSLRSGLFLASKFLFYNTLSESSAPHSNAKSICAYFPVFRHSLLSPVQVLIFHEVSFSSAASRELLKTSAQ